MEKICFVVQRYGLEINGGAELHCRQLAEKMSAKYDVEVYTTCAKDYITWKNEYTPGDEDIHGVLVHRYPVDRERTIETFSPCSARVLEQPHHLYGEEVEWLEEQGPVSTKLLDDLDKKHTEYKAIIFMTYLYYLTAMGAVKKYPNALMIPTLHDEPPAYLYHYQRVFESIRGFIWNTPVEKAFAEKRFYGIESIPGIFAGVGVDVPTGELPALPEPLEAEKYIVYAGRIDVSKGCDKMFESFLRYRREYQRDIKLAIMGKEVLSVPEDEGIVKLGFVSDKMKFSVMKQAKALVLFSEFESLSMIVLESLIMNRPVLVNGKCEVLADHCRRSNAGFYFKSYREFAEELEYLFTHEEEYRQLCANGSVYVKENYQWGLIVDRIDGLIKQVCR